MLLHQRRRTYDVSGIDDAVIHEDIAAATVLACLEREAEVRLR